MRINIFSYKNAQELILKDEIFRKNWISIRDVGFEYLYEDIDKYCKNVLELKFDDVTMFNIEHDLLHPFYVKVKEKRELVLFNEKLAQQVIDFSSDIFYKNEELNIHCWAGKSRSQGLGFVLNQYFNLYLTKNLNDYKDNLNNNIDNFLGNFDVIRLMTKQLYK